MNKKYLLLLAMFAALAIKATEIFVCRYEGASYSCELISDPEPQKKIELEDPVLYEGPGDSDEVSP